jgi:hypothetical protein
MLFRKRIRVFPGFHLNLSKSGISSSIGVRGASVTISKKGTYLNTGIPGSGLYDRTRLDGTDKREHIGNSSAGFHYGQNLPNTSEEIKSESHSELTSTDLVELKDILESAHVQRNEVIQEILKTNAELDSSKRKHKIAKYFILGFILPSFRRNISQLNEYLADLKYQLNSISVDIDNHFDDVIGENYKKLSHSFISLTQADSIWDKTTQRKTDKETERTLAAQSISRGLVKFSIAQIPVIKSEHNGFLIQNLNGGDLYIYPGFVLVTSEMDIQKFGLIKIKDIELSFCLTPFMEKDRIPSDSKVVGSTWAKVNKNGEPDKRYKDNFEIPIVKYAELNFLSKSGLKESFLVSNIDSARTFFDYFIEYQKALE